jgi:hypothetical protein
VSGACFMCGLPAAFRANVPPRTEVFPVCLPCALGVPSLAAAVERYKATALPPVPVGMFAVRIRPGVERGADGRWRPMCHVTEPDGQVYEHTGVWLEGADAEQRAEAIARDLAATIRETLNHRHGRPVP